jgi:hypothetical protein
LGGFAYWIRGWIHALHGTVNAQQRTIDAFKTLLDASDTPKMLERFESHKKLTDIAADAVREEWDRESDLLCCFEIDDELELLRPLYREVDCPTRRQRFVMCDSKTSQAVMIKFQTHAEY